MGTMIATILLSGVIGTILNPNIQPPSFIASDNIFSIAFHSGDVPNIDSELASATLGLPTTSKANARDVSREDFGVFNSVAISAARLPAAQKWQVARQTDYAAFFSASCESAGLSQCDSHLAGQVRGAVENAADLDDRGILDLINRTVNGAIAYRDDSAVWGTGDYWANPTEIADKGAGDCEDFAIAKYWALRSMGLADEQLQIVVLQDTRRQLFHAVLVAHMESGSYVLDNVSNRLVTDTAYGQYQPIMSFAGGQNFIHGFESGATNIAAMPADLSMIAPGSGL